MSRPRRSRLWTAGRAAAAFLVLGCALSIVSLLHEATVARAAPLYTFQGLCYSPYRDGESPETSTTCSQDNIDEDMNVIRPLLPSKNMVIRSYSSTHGNQSIPSIAAKHGILVWQGAWLGRSGSQNKREIDALVSLAKSGSTRVAIVGNEVLQRHDLTETQLLSHIKQTKRRIGKVPVATAELWGTWLRHPKLAKAVDCIVVHIYPYWDGVAASGGSAYVVRCYRKVKAKYPGKHIVIGETGWPSAGPKRGNARPSPANQRLFVKQFRAAAKKGNIPYFLFSSFDEEWKSEGGVGAHWGVLDSSGQLKPALSGVLATPTVCRQSVVVYPNNNPLKTLAAGYDLGVNSSGGNTEWLADMCGYMRMAYPPGQSWGVVFITMGPPTDPPRLARDLSRYRYLLVDLKGEAGGESVEVGIKDNSDPDDGTEARVRVDNLTTDWKTYAFELAGFDTADLKRLYVVAEFVSVGSHAQTVCFKNVKYSRDNPTQNHTVTIPLAQEPRGAVTAFGRLRRSASLLRVRSLDRRQSN